MKHFDTPEQCLEEMGEHCWGSPYDPNPGYGCLVYHPDGKCGMHAPTRACAHCRCHSREGIWNSRIL